MVLSMERRCVAEANGRIGEGEEPGSYGLTPVKPPYDFLTDFVLQSLNLHESTAQESRDARAEVGDDDQAHIRGLVTGISFVRRGAASL